MAAGSTTYAAAISFEPECWFLPAAGWPGSCHRKSSYSVCPTAPTTHFFTRGSYYVGLMGNPGVPMQGPPHKASASDRSLTSYRTVCRVVSTRVTKVARKTLWGSHMADLGTAVSRGPRT